MELNKRLSFFESSKAGIVSLNFLAQIQMKLQVQLLCSSSQVRICVVLTDEVSDNTKNQLPMLK